MVRIAIDSGHGLNTSGKEVPAYMGVGKIKEWTLNDRITKKVINMLLEYENVEILRLDDKTGKTDVPLSTRTKKANDFKADILISNHHNAGINGGRGGGTVVFRYPNSSKFTKSMQVNLYNSLIKQTGLKGNRASPITEANFQILRQSKMGAVLIENGFMDSKTDIKQIMTDEFSTKSAKGIVDFLIMHFKLKKKPKPKTETKAPTGKLYKVQVGAFGVKENAEKLKTELEKKGYKPFIKIE